MLAHLDAGRLAGRGGAGFPLAAKLRALAAGTPRTVIVNGTESEPASRKDRVLLRRTPHLVLDGALAVAARRSAPARSPSPCTTSAAAPRVRAAAQERPDGRPGAGRTSLSGGFVAGEARAVVRAPRRRAGAADRAGARRPPPTAILRRQRRDVRAARGAAAPRPAPLRRHRHARRAGHHAADRRRRGRRARASSRSRSGTPLGIVLAAARRRRDPQAVVVGGYHGAWLAPIPQIRLSRAGLAAAGGTFGAGVLLVVDHDTCALGELARGHPLAGRRVGASSAGRAASACPRSPPTSPRCTPAATGRRPPRSATPAPSTAAAPAPTPTAPPASSRPACTCCTTRPTGTSRTAAAAGRCSAGCPSEVPR